jgi:hypothetical protein
MHNRDWQAPACASCSKKPNEHRWQRVNSLLKTSHHTRMHVCAVAYTASLCLQRLVAYSVMLVKCLKHHPYAQHVDTTDNLSRKPHMKETPNSTIWPASSFAAACAFVATCFACHQICMHAIDAFWHGSPFKRKLQTTQPEEITTQNRRDWNAHTPKHAP